MMQFQYVTTTHVAESNDGDDDDNDDGSCMIVTLLCNSTSLFFNPYCFMSLLHIFKCTLE